MLFNSISFLIFLPIVFLLFWVVKKTSVRNVILIIASYYFYGSWDWRFLFLIFASSLVDFLIGLALNNSDDARNKKWLLSISMIVNLGMLGFFKYYNFFITSLSEGLNNVGLELNNLTLQIILPVGISFYTFQTMSYTIDVYNNKIKATRDPLAFFAYVSFFPQLVAGPIERATHLLPQFIQPRKFNYSQAISGSKLILWGFFKKMVIADNCAIMANEIFNNYEQKGSVTLVLGAIFFAFQIYGDFSGYSDIAIGVSRWFNISLMKNFSLPYFSRNIGEFWRRWHISLNTWFRDYIYIPLGGSRGSQFIIIRNILAIFLISGLWHGANWTYVLWGLINALFFLPLLLRGTNKKHQDIVAHNSLFPSIKDLLAIKTTFIITCFAWIFFRSPTVNDAFRYIGGIASFKPSINLAQFAPYLFGIILLMMIEWIGRKKDCPIDFNSDSLLLKYVFYASFVFVIIFFGATEKQSFIYFQF